MTIQPLDPRRTDDVRSIVTLMETVLEKLVSLYDQSGVPLPERRYWTMAAPAWDCEQLVVSFTQAYYGPPGDEAAEPVRCDGPRTATLVAQVVRCIPTAGARGTPPKPAAIQSASEALAVDAWLLLDVIKDLESWDPYGGPGLGVIATVDAGEAQGGYQGVSLNLTMAIP